MLDSSHIPQRKTAFIKSFGCQMNVYDGERMSDLLADSGYGTAASVEQADLVILNTCHIRERASQKIYSELGLLRELKEERASAGKTTMIAVAGCLAQAEGPEIMRRQRAVDLVVGPQSYHRLPLMLADAGNNKREIAADFTPHEKFARLPAAKAEQIRARGVTALLTVQEGCDKFCSFCVVPYTRGAEMSRPVSDVLADAQRLADSGVRELTLLGQNVNAYRGADGAGTVGLASLMHQLALIPGIVRLRYMTSHPLDMDDALNKAHRDLPALMPFLHLPVQSGSDSILAAMNRRHTADDYRRVIDDVRRARGDIALSSDFIVGFPGESDADFAATLKLIEDIGFHASYSFKYSRRAGTPGADRPGQIEEHVMRARLAELQALLDQQRMTYARAMVGQTVDVLFEKPGRHEGQLIGRTPHMHSVYADADSALIGQIAAVEIIATGSNSLVGRVAGSRPIVSPMEIMPMQAEA